MIEFQKNLPISLPQFNLERFVLPIKLSLTRSEMYRELIFPNRPNWQCSNAHKFTEYDLRLIYF